MTAYNEQAVIADTICDCLAVLTEIPGDHEILVVNDGSTDRTGVIMNDLSTKYPRLRVLVHPENRGVAQAQRWLIHEAKGSLIFHIGADGEWRASELHEMLHKLNQGYDIVVGVRRQKHYSPYRAMVSWIYNMLVFILFGKNFHDIGSIRLVRANLWKRIPSDAKSAFFIAEKLLLAHRNGARIGFVPVDHVWRSTGRSKLSNPLRVIEAFRELCHFWVSPRSRLKIDLWGREAAAAGAADRSNVRKSVKLPPEGAFGQHPGDTAQPS